ncbi:tetraspanin-33-like [Liolophura sinensis]|uniref:tetraspanin-33-like n=1 Tax=Liolophura sinensis TaxID=3198878 RepID=UPI00315961CC
MARNVMDLHVMEVDFGYSLYQPPRCLQCSCWVKYSLFFINFFSWVGGSFMFAVGVWARLNSTSVGALNDIAIDPSLMVIAVGCIVFIISGIACIGAVRENVCLLLMFCIALGIVFVLEVVAGILAFALLGHVEGHMTAQITSAIVQYEDCNTMKTVMDSLQEWYKCCGAGSFRDWQHNVYYNCSSPANTRCGVPASCCQHATDLKCGFEVQRYLDSYASTVVFTNGCVQELLNVFKNNLLIIGFIAFGFGFMELFCMMLAYNLIRSVTSVPRRPVYHYDDSNDDTDD